ncbi:MAG: AAA family ATPase, partial [Desulfobacteraceae bacterium]|nr:AAA family ATPase [Desulfobacteraceae bacterium]
MAECSELLKILNKEDVYAGLYMDLVKKATDVSDTYFWLDKKEAFKLKDVVLQVKETAAGAIDEFEKVIRIKKNTVSEVARVSARAREILDRMDPGSMNAIDLFVNSLSDLRSVRGEIISLKDLRYVDLPAVESLETEVSEATDNLSGVCVEFLLKPEALEPYENHVAEIEKSIEELKKVSDAKAVEEKADASSGELEMLIEIVSNLKIEDSTQTTRIIENISDIYSKLNQVRAGIKNKKKSLQSVEGVAQFNAQVKLLNQSVINYLDICDTPERCDEYLTKVMIQVEELEGRFADFDDFIVQLSEKRDELYNAFESKKLNLVEARNKRANTLMSSAERILKGIQNRVGTMDEVNAINGYFASDLMIEKVRDIVSQLLDLNDSVKADDIQSRLKTIREDAVRQLKDRKELYTDGANVIRFGEHKFSVNVQPLDLTIVRRDGQQVFHLTGTNFFEPIDNDDFMETQAVWDMEVPSESKTVYRAEYLAFQMLKEYDPGEVSDEELPGRVQQFMGPRYTEGYTKGIHDHDGAKILNALAGIHTSIGLLRFHPKVRALGRLFWILFSDQTKKELIGSKLNSFGIMSRLFPVEEKQENYIRELEELLDTFTEQTRLFSRESVPDAADYLFQELLQGEKFAVSREASGLMTGFAKHLRSKRFAEKFKNARAKLEAVPTNEFELVRDWVRGYVSTLGQDELNDYIDEASALIFTRKGELTVQSLDVSIDNRQSTIDNRQSSTDNRQSSTDNRQSSTDNRQSSTDNRQSSIDNRQSMSADIEGMVGDHGAVQNGIYRLNYHKFMEKLTHHETKVLPLFSRYHDLKKELTDQMREEMRLDEFKPRILTSFVRNKLINQVYLPIVGDNLAKQMGVAGEAKRTDLMGMLLLVSPPGYGKTTLMEYLANRLGIIFMKINGPAIGYNVTSLDPAEAPNASAREEVQKLNLSLEMGDNVMLYLDDIQHCNPELLQKFISLCDAQRKIEGVYKGKTRTYDLRGKKVVVVMAGNPYTESGEKFKIPDMLANRADTYNLGDIIGDTEDVFKMSYLENALTSNPVLNKLSSRSQEDVYSIINIAETGTREGVDFAGTYSGEEVSEMVSV